MKSQRDSSFLADGHKAILNEMNKDQQKANERWQQKHRLGTVRNKLLGVGA